jgi:Flp pilus assembly protein TadG
MTLARRLALKCGDRAGSTAVESALVFIPFIMLVVGGFYAAGLAFAAASMQFAAEAAARCAAVQTTVCTGSSTTVTYANSHYLASSLGTPTFTYSASGCGNVVSGTLTYVLDIGLSKINVPLTSTACFP